MVLSPEDKKKADEILRLFKSLTPDAKPIVLGALFEKKNFGGEKPTMTTEL